MLLNKERVLLLALAILFFAVLAVGYTWWRVNYKKNHFPVGNVPVELINQLLPKEIPLDSMRPPAIRITDPLRYGGATSVISVIEYGDFECPACKQMAPEIKRALQPFGGRVRFVWRDFPISEIHRQAMPAAIFARCAGIQGRFWEAYDELMAAPILSDSVYRQIAGKIGLNADALASCRSNPTIEAAIKKDVEESKADGIHGTPFLFIGTNAVDTFITSDELTTQLKATHSGL